MPEEEIHLKVYLNRSVLVKENGQSETFKEGSPNPIAKSRLETIKQKLSSGFLKNLIEECKNPSLQLGDVTDQQLNILHNLVSSVTSQYGRGLVCLTILQLSIKCICPEQSIRLHKGGRGDFSWEEGIPMRVLDKTFITPTLREYDLLRLNADGGFMTRTLAENYPYSKVYKAAVRGARDEWLEVVDLIENRTIDPNIGLRHIIVLLLNKSEKFIKSAKEAINRIKKIIRQKPSANQIISFISKYVSSSSYSARLFEVSMHSLFQVLEDTDALEGVLKPLSQMRSANKKHGDIGDIQITIGPGTLQIQESWDAKFGKPYLRDELDELSEKLNDHPETKLAGFVVDKKPDKRQEIIDRIKELEHLHDMKVFILSFDEWAKNQLNRGGKNIDDIARQWLLAFVETLCQKRRNRAPIDEPSDQWVAELNDAAKSWLNLNK